MTNEELLRQIERLDQKIDSRLDRFADKLDDVGSEVSNVRVAISRMEGEVERNRESLEEHMRRTDAVESLVEAHSKLDSDNHGRVLEIIGKLQTSTDTQLAAVKDDLGFVALARKNWKAMVTLLVIVGGSANGKDILLSLAKAFGLGG